MARKLKSDKLLFTATLLLVCTSIVMVYSASAVMAMQRFQQPVPVPGEAGGLGAVGLAALPIVMRVDYRNYRQPAVIWTALGRGRRWRSWRCCSRRGSTARRRWLASARSAFSRRSSRRSRSILFMAALLERRMERIDEVGYSLLPIGVVLGAVVGLILAEPDLGTAACIVMIAAMMVFAAGHQLPLRDRARSRGVPVVYLLLMHLRLPAAARHRLPRSVGGSARRRLADDPVDDRGRHRRRVRPRLMGGVQKLFYLPEPHNDFIYSVIGEELGLIGDHAGARVLLRDRLARAADGDARAGSVRRVPGDRPDHDGRVPGVLQHQRRARAAADEGDSAAVRQRRRVVAAHQPGGHGHSPERVAARVRLRTSSRRRCRSQMHETAVGRDCRRWHGRPSLSRASPWRGSCCAREPDAVVTFAGTARGIEARVIPREGFALDLLRSAGLKGTSLAARARGLGAAAARAGWTRGGFSRGGGRIS